MSKLVHTLTHHMKIMHLNVDATPHKTEQGSP